MEGIQRNRKEEKDKKQRRRSRNRHNEYSEERKSYGRRTRLKGRGIR